jgi:hypothetical protein
MAKKVKCAHVFEMENNVRTLSQYGVDILMRLYPLEWMMRFIFGGSSREIIFTKSCRSLLNGSYESSFACRVE